METNSRAGKRSTMENANKLVGNHRGAEWRRNLTRKRKMRFEKGNTAAVGHGRPIASRQKIAEALLKDIASVWERRGAEVLEKLANDDPAALAKIAFGLIPREIAASLTVQAQQTPQGLTQDEWHRLVALLRIPRDMGIEGSPDEIAERCEAAIRAEFARPVLTAPPPL
jgi:hypothetical protein